MTADLKLVRLKNEQIKPGIDPRAEVHPQAHLGKDCTVGAFAVIGPDVQLGDNCVVHPHGVLSGPTVAGDNNEIFPFACIGGAPQDLRHKGEPTTLEIGNGNVFREHVTVGRGTVHGGGVTRIGDNNLVMAYCHIAHDCIIGNNVVMANNATLAGHVSIQDYAVFGGIVAVASFLRIGESAMLAAGSMLERDVPPFAMVAGDRARLKGVNRVGIGRRGFGDQARRQIKEIIRKLKLSDQTTETIVAGYSGRDNLTPEAGRLLEFICRSERGVTR